MTSSDRALCLTLLVAAAFHANGRSADAGERTVPPRPPRTIAAALDALETLVSPEARAALLATPEADLAEWRSGIADVMGMRWGALSSDPLRPLLQALEGKGVPAADAAAYLVTSLARRHRGVKLDAIEQLTPFREERNRRNEARMKARRKTGMIVYADHPLEIMDVVTFAANSATLSQVGEELLDAIAVTMRGRPELRQLEVQGHAAANERGGRALSLQRARAVVDALVDRGISSARFTAHGLGADYPIVRNGPRRPERDRRAEFLILRRPG